MMSTTSDSLLPSKKRITTYGRKRTGASPALGSQDSSRKPSPSLARPTPQATRSSSRSTSPVKRLAPVEPSSSQSANVLPSRERSENGKDGTRVVKRKQSQGQATNRQVKKQRSSSPDSAVYDIYDDIPSSPKQAPRSKPVPAKANPPRARNRVTPPKDTAMKNAAIMSPFSPATSKTLSSLSVSSRNTASTQSAQQQIPIRPPRKAPVDFGPPLAKPSKEKATEPEPQSLPAQGDARPRTRLIDALAAQAESSDSMDDSEDDADFAALGLKRTLPSSQHADTAPDSNSQSLATPSQTRSMVARETSLLSKKSGVKFTYSQERTVLAENPLLDSAGSGLDLWSQSLLPDSQPKASQMSIDEDLEDNSGAVRSLHELRQAGANNRCADEMDDLLDRIGIPSQGKPSSARRTALLELSEKIQDKAFRRQFRDHGGEPNVFNRIGKEVDLIAGYTIISILTTILASPPVPDPLLLQQLQTQGIANLFATLIAEERDISSVARDRKSNLSKHTQTTVANLKTTILNLPNLWSHPPPQLPPRTLALKCLDLIIPAHSSTMTVEHEIATSAIVDQLFEILSSAAGDAESESWDFPHSTESINLYLALNLLVKHSVPVMQSSLGPDWTSRHLPTVADILEASLLRKADKLGELDVRALKLTMNTANNNPKAPSIFLKRGVLRELAGVVCRTFGEVLHPTAGEGFKPATFDSLVLMLGVMINFAEHEPTAGRTLLESQSALQSLDNLIRIFLDNCSTTHEADSEESSQLNVLFGYLSVLLGYLSVYKPVRERFGAVQRGGNLRPLISSVQEFIAYYNKVVDHAENDNSTGRLQALVETLEHS